MIETPAYAASYAREPLKPFTIERREPGPNDILIDVLYCGICHSDIHQARGEWGGEIFPMVPGHEIVGRVAKVGSAVTKWAVGDTAGVGCFVDSCRTCAPCAGGDEQYCEGGGMILTYNGYEADRKTPTYGGYSKRITVDESYALRVPAGLPLERVAPLLCAGITTYSPLAHFGPVEGLNVAVLGLGGLGHMGVKIAKAMGAHVTVLSHSPKKAADAARLGADEFVDTTAKGAFKENASRFDFLLDTVSAAHDYNAYLSLVALDGVMVLVGVPDPTPLKPGSLIMKRRSLAGSLIGGLRETQEMLDFCAAKNALSDVEVIAAKEINDAYERTIAGDVRYRFVIDASTIG